MRKLDKRNLLDIEQPSASQNDFGESLESWSLYQRVYGAIQGIGGREYIISDVKNSEIDYRVYTEYIEGVKPTMRIKFGTRYFAIKSVINTDELNRELQLLCKEVIS
jgi:SPP1 family predicted phage head-tail adaptor